MNKEASDTFPEDEQTRWQETLAEDVFLPTVRVQLYWKDVEAAVESGAIVPQQAHALWANWAMPGSSTRMGAIDSEAPAPTAAVAAASLIQESSWPVRNPMPTIEKPSRMSGAVGFVVGALMVLIAVAIYNQFM